jgi:multimeric flavodoxin WrbA
MKKRVLVLSGSARKNGNSSILCDQFISGAEEAGHESEKVYVSDKVINYCIGCSVCKGNGGKCVRQDDMSEIIEKMKLADVIVLATPVYFYSMDAQMKVLIDRTYAGYREMKNKDFYIIVTGAANEKHYFKTAVDGLKGFIRCVPGAKGKGIIYGIDSGEVGDVKNTKAMNEAYEMGKAV